MKKTIIIALCLLAAATFRIQSQTTLTTDLVSYWKLDETSGSVIDATNSNPGTVNGATANLTGRIIKAYSFDGVDDGIDVGNSSTLSIGTSDYSISLWIKTSAVLTSTGNLYTLLSNQIQGGSNLGYSFFLRGGSYNGILLRIGNGTSYYDLIPSINQSSTLSNNGWHHLVISIDRDGISKIYIDNVNAGSFNFSAINGSNISATSNTKIGISSEGGGSSGFNGMIDEVGIWKKALSPQEVTSLYNAGNGLSHPFVASIPVTNISVSPNPGSVNVGGTLQLTAAVLPANATDQTIIWQNMSNTAWFSMNSTGLVTALGPAGSPGTFGAFAHNGVSGTASVTIVAANIPVTGVSVSPTSSSIYVANSVQLTATVAPSSATNKSVTWTSISPGVATVSTSGLVSGVAAGTTTITVTTVDGNKTATCNVIVSIPAAASWILSGNNTYYSAGNVGIGTSLNLANAKLTVNGKILAKEVEVVSSIASDFVFEPEYALMPLTELEKYLKTHKHLPGIPSAVEFSKKGQNLAEMDDMLLRKIEELTLYIIKDNELLLEQQNLIQELKKEVNTIKAFYKTETEDHLKQ